MPVPQVAIPASDSVSEIQELRAFCGSAKLNLFVLIREFEKFGLSSIRMQVDYDPAVDAFGRVRDYQLGDGLWAVLAAFRAEHVNPEKIESRSGEVGARLRDEEGLMPIV